jgi:hypothetical protein
VSGVKEARFNSPSGKTLGRTSGEIVNPRKFHHVELPRLTYPVTAAAADEVESFKSSFIE